MIQSDMKEKPYDRQNPGAQVMMLQKIRRRKHEDLSWDVHSLPWILLGWKQSRTGVWNDPRSFSDAYNNWLGIQSL